ncbi:sigma-54 interaction domain-containing protein [Alicyclobacillus suci]|uniref:sigma-54 interaction domain-containing protein n=1 Tax=Alicyclobacillus suci TaxID=2816080 RepID=UPI0011BEFF50|nr:sigma 54-interacting transcriptional regulator [Alicyclobacillus suci]
MHAIQDSADVLQLILDTMYEGIVLVDQHGRVREMNQAYLKLLNLEKEAVLGKHVTDVIENTRIHHVLETGIPERGHLQRIQGHDMVVHRIPIWQDGKVIGAVGVLIFESMSDLYRIIERTQAMLHNEGEKHSASAPPEHVVLQKRVYTIDETIGQTHAIKVIKQMAKKAAKTPVTVLITGESGTGKEVLAQGIHYESAFANGPFVSVNCAAIPEPLLEAELFGYDDGAFTGARKGGKPGQIELAHMGTLFLDEIGDMPLNMQAKLLRFLEDKEIQRVGGVTKRRVHTRIIAATNRDLEAMVRSGQFREDLYYRLNIIRLHLPPLRSRREDIPLLLEFYLEQVSKHLNQPDVCFDSNVVQLLMQYDWPGNIRELVHTVEVLVSLADSPRITKHDFPPHLTKFFEMQRHSEMSPVPVPASGVGWPPRTKEPTVSSAKNVRETMANHEMTVIRQALLDAHGNKSLAAKKLGIHRSTLYEKLKRYGLR